VFLFLHVAPCTRCLHPLPAPAARQPLTAGRYLVFFDDDAVLEHAKYSDAQLEQTMRGPIDTLENPWRVFEKYLKEYKPAIGFPHFSWQARNESLEVQAVPMFDAMVTAFHRDVWQFVFPYETRWDHQASCPHICIFIACFRRHFSTWSVFDNFYSVRPHSYAVLALVLAPSFSSSQHVFPPPPHSI
jgi:hypothetical protein